MPSIPPSKQPVHTLLSIIIAACFIVPLVLYAAADTSAETYVFDGIARSHVHITESGKFIFFNALSSGTYNLNVSAPGYMTDRRAIDPNDADMDVTIILKAAKASASSASWNPLPGPGVLAAMAALAGGVLLWRKKKP